MNRYHMVVLGRVQGVGFRYFVQYCCTLLKLTGWVRNLEDGSVELEAQGSEENITKLIEKLKKGNGFSRVHHIEINPVDVVSKDKNFKIFS